MQRSHSGTNTRHRALIGMQWIEALLNVSAFVAFVGIATQWPENQPPADHIP
jgi:hypothetical protein